MNGLTAAGVILVGMLVVAVLIALGADVLVHHLLRILGKM